MLIWNKSNYRSLSLVAMVAVTTLNWGCGNNPKKTLENIAECGRDTCGGNGGDGDAPTKPANEYPEFQLTMSAYADCADLQAKTHSRLLTHRAKQIAWNDYYEKLRRSHSAKKSAPVSSAAESADSAGPSAASGAGAPQATPAESSITNTQETSIDESDFVKAGSKSLFVARGNLIEVIDRTSLAKRGTINLGDTKINGENLFVVADKLVVVAHGLSDSINVKIFAKDSGESAPAIERETNYRGTFNDARLSNGHLIIVLNDQLPVPTLNNREELSNEVPSQPITVSEDASVANIPCRNIVQPQVLDEDWRMTKVVSINIENPAATPHSIALLGAGDQIYMGADSLYVAKQGLQWSWGFPGDNMESYSRRQETLIITRVKFDAVSGSLTPVAIGAVHGRAKDQWAFKEFSDHGGTLAVATSTGQLWASKNEEQAQNHIYFLTSENGSLRQLSALHDFGTGEDIRSVRYIDRTAYVVTFKKTDPLFAFDLTDLANPKQLGELKIPGFSTYMHPVAPGRIVGVGFDAEDHGDFAYFAGIKVSLFNTADPTNMSQLDAKIIGARGSISDATGNHHGFFFDKKNNLLGIPVIEVRGGSGGNFGRGPSFAGAIIYKVGDRGLTEVSRLTHSDLTPARCKDFSQGSWWSGKSKSYDINRIYNIDDRLITVSRFGVKSHDIANPASVTATTRFDPLSDSHLNDLGICRSYTYWQD